MNKITNYLTLLPFLLLPFLFSACNNDDDSDDTETPVINSNFPKGVASYNYSVQVVPGNSSFDGGKVSGIEGATVTISQGGNSQVQQTVAGGMAHFEGINPGSINGTVITNEDDPAVNFTAEIMAETLNSDSNQVRNASTTITVFQKNAELQARIYGNYTFTPTNPFPIEDPANTDRTTVFVVYRVVNYPMGSGSGRLTNVNVELSSIFYTSPTTGRIRISDIPGTVDGLLEAELFMQDIVKINPTDPGYDVLFNIHPIRNQPGTPLNLVPGGILNLGDIEAKRRI